jgi:hypothetical protein
MPNATITWQLDVRWPLYTVYPAAAASFWAGYLFLWPLLLNCHCCARRQYSGLDRIGKMCFRANLGSAVHSYFVVLLLAIMLAHDTEMRTNRLQQHYNPIGYSAMVRALCRSFLVCLSEGELFAL